MTLTAAPSALEGVSLESDEQHGGAPKRMRIATRTVEDSIFDGATSARRDGKPAHSSSSPRRPSCSRRCCT
jgi:hypothetical protein